MYQTSKESMVTKKGRVSMIEVFTHIDPVRVVNLATTYKCVTEEVLTLFPVP